MPNEINSYPLNTILRVTWKDASTRGRWDSLDEYRKHDTADCVSVGYLVTHSKDRIVLAQTQSLDSDVNGAIAIPFVWVINIERLTATKFPKTKRKLLKQ